MRTALTKSLLGRRSVGAVRSRANSSLVLGEHDGKVLSPGTLAAVTAASELSDKISLFLSGDSAKEVCAESLPEKVDSVEISPQIPGAKAMASHLVNRKYSHILAASSTMSKELWPRIATALNVSPIMDIVQVIDTKTFIRPTYAGNALAKIQVKDSTKPIVATIRPTAFDKAHVVAKAYPPEFIDIASDPKAPTILSSSSSASADRPDLTTAKSIVAGGRGMKSSEHFGMLQDLASKLNSGAVGASRAAVDAGMVPNELQIGQTGKVVAPDLYLAVGISGAIQHLSGMKDSKLIVAINKDAEAPIFQVADFGLVADLFQAVPEFSQKI